MVNPSHIGERNAARSAATCHTRLVSAMVLICMALCSPLRADSAAMPVNEIKAAFVINIARFVTWPRANQTNKPLNLCLYRGSSIGKAARSLEGKLVNGRPLHIQRAGSLYASKTCHIIVIPEDQLKSYGTELAHLPPRAVLSIADLTGSEHKGQAWPGVLMSLVRTDSHLGFEVNLAEVRKSGLKLSSELLKLAHILDNGGSP